MVKGETTQDLILGGRVRLRQPAEGYRAGLDAALLAAACDAAVADRVVEAGCGAGAVMAAAATRRPGATFFGIERDPALVRLARANIAENGLAGRVAAVAGDIARPFLTLGLEPFDSALANPPYFDDPASLRGPKPAKRGAWLAGEGLAAWVSFLAGAVRDGGSITLIHRADRLADILARLAPTAGSFQVRPVHPFADTPAKRILVRAIRSGRAPLMLLPPLFVHERGGAKHTPAAEAILRGEADLGWMGR
ncbi:MAG: tRNA1(Val) (adenine(37)-N6)-methyltransferase [Caulobacteraceae bacterium]